MVLACCVFLVAGAPRVHAQPEAVFDSVFTADLPECDITKPDDYPGEIFLPAGMRVTSIIVSKGTAIVDLSPEVLEQLDEAVMNALAEQFRQLFSGVPEVTGVVLTVNGEPLSSYLPAPPSQLELFSRNAMKQAFPVEDESAPTAGSSSLAFETQSTAYIVESRSGGQNYAQYSETGTWANSTGKSTASGCTAGIGSRYCMIGSTAGTATFRFTPAVSGAYEVFTTNAITTNSGNPTMHTVSHAGGSANVAVCQNSTCTPNPCNTWYSLGTYTLNAGIQYTVTVSGSTAAGSAPAGNVARADAIKWESSAMATEFRGMWVDVWGVGMRTTTEINDLVSRAVQGRYNAILPEVLAYHDNASSAHGAFWNSSIVPKATVIQSGLDPLVYLCQQAHAQGIEVHPWLVPFRASSTWPPSGNSTLSAHNEYVMVPRASMGTGPTLISDAYYLDPGSPGVQEYLLDIVRELVTQYPIDGVHFDYVRYVQTDAGYPAVSSYPGSSLRRFQAITGRGDTPPATGDTAWNDFRRRTITELIRRARAEIPSMPSSRQPVRLSASVITWGNAPSTFQSSSAYGLFSNWEEWQRLGLLDTCVPMTYYAESSYPTYYRNWVNKEMAWRYDRHMVVGPGIYLNTFSQSLTQMQYAQNAGADGLSTYSYRVTRSDAGSVWDWYPYVAANLWTEAASVPSMPWRDPAMAVEGTLWGRVTASGSGDPLDDAQVQVGALDAVRTDGNGYYAVTLIPASSGGTNYTVTVSKPGFTMGSRDTQVLAGDVKREDFSLVSGGDPPTITAQPASIMAASGSRAVFAVQATGSPALTYQWQKNQVDLNDGGHYSGCTTDTLVIYPVGGSDAAYYRCVITNAYGSNVSDQASLTLGTLGGSYLVESRWGGLNYSQYSEAGTWSDSVAKSSAEGCTPGIGSRYCSIGSGGTATFRFTPSTTGSYEIFTTNASTVNSGNPLIHTVTHVSGPTDRPVCQNTTCSPSAAEVWLSLGTYALNAGTEYTVTADSSTAVGSAPVGNVARADAIRWTQVVIGTAPPTITQQPTAQSVCETGTAHFTVAASGEGTLSYQWQKDQVDLSNGGHYSGVTTPALTVSNADAGDVANYRCVVSNAGGSTNSTEAALTLRAATTITQHPVDQTVTTGETALFTVSAGGYGSLGYQWQKDAVNLTNGGHYSGVTTATLTISNCDSNDVADYRCVVTAGCGSAISNAASLTVSGPVTVLWDDFSYNNSSAFRRVWPISVSPGGSVSTSGYYSWPKSIYFSTSAARNYRNITPIIATDAVPIVWTFQLYDGAYNTLDRQFCELADTDSGLVQLLAMGKYNLNDTMRTHYAARVAFSPGPNWITLNDPGAPTRGIGWHEFQAVIYATTIDFYVDGVLAKANVPYANYVGQFSFDQARIGSGLSSTSSAYVDDVSIVSGQ